MSQTAECALRPLYHKPVPQAIEGPAGHEQIDGGTPTSRARKAESLFRSAGPRSRNTISAISLSGPVIMVSMSPQCYTPMESELTLVVCSQHPRRVAKEICGLVGIAEFSFLPLKPCTLHDYYFDTPGGELGLRQWALRVRRIGREHWITLKGPPSSSESGLVERAEIEVRWSPDALPLLRHRLASIGIRLNPLLFDPLDPLGSLNKAGLKMAQRRDTRRQVRGVHLGHHKPLLAELAIDEVTYRWPRGEVIHYEVEIEANSRDGIRAVEALAGHLVMRFKGSLRKWAYSKLATGRAIEELLATGALADMVNRSKALKPAAYDLIDTHLRL